MGQALVQRLRSVAAREISDRSAPVPDATIWSVIDDFSYNLTSRRPLPALVEVVDDAELAKVQFDFATFAQELAEREAVIMIPDYQRMGKKAAARKGEVRIGNQILGPIIGLTSHDEIFKFGITVLNQSILGEDQRTGRQTLGRPRNYTVFINTPSGGVWHLIRGMEFSPDRDENRWLFENSQATADTSVLVFKTFVPEQVRWVPYGGRFITLKGLVQRLVEERQFLNREKKRLKTLGVDLRGTRYDDLVSEPFEPPEAGEDDTVSVQLPGFQCRVTWPYINDYKPMTDDVDGLGLATTRWKLYGNFLQKLRFAERSVLYPFAEKGGRALDPHWIKAPWEGPTRMKDIPGGINKGAGSTIQWEHRIIENVGDNDFLRDAAGSERAPIRLLVRSFDKSIKIASYLLDG